MLNCKLMVLFLLSLSFLCGCVSLHKKNMATQVDATGNKVTNEKASHWNKETTNGLVISGEVNAYKSSKYFGYIDFVFENKSQEWLVIKKVALNFGNKNVNDKVKFVSGLPLEVYMEAVQEKLKMDAENEKTAAAVLAGVAAGMTYADKSRSTLPISAALLGGAISLSVDSFNKNREQIDGTKIFPKNHLFNEEFIIPPGMFRKKWVVLNTRDHEEIGEIKEIKLTYWLTNGNEETVNLSINDYSSWQSNRE
ncbi:MAG: hypothetical protein HQK52_19570 [Oligoflexia bacterium]|nr:hypothetical protein [Oligoflexia bacterium]